MLLGPNKVQQEKTMYKYAVSPSLLFSSRKPNKICKMGKISLTVHMWSTSKIQMCHML